MNRPYAVVLTALLALAGLVIAGLDVAVGAWWGVLAAISAAVLFAALSAWINRTGAVEKENDDA